MKKIVCVIAVVLFMLSMGAMMKATVNDRYTRDAVVVEVDGTIISAEDNSGNVWCYGVDGDTVPQVGSKVVLTLLAMGSDTIYDDKVVDVGQG